MKAQRWGFSTDCRWLKYVVGLPVAMALLPASVTLVRSQQPPKPPQQEMEIAPALPAYTPKGKRDPFKSPFDKKKAEPKTEFDVAPPRNSRPPGPAGLLVSDAQLMGVVQGPTGRVAMIAGDGTLTYFLKVGDRLYDGSIIEIAENSIKLVREFKISSKVMDQQEVVKKISPAP